jgi:hypothetical protein
MCGTVGIFNGIPSITNIHENLSAGSKFETHAHTHKGMVSSYAKLFVVCVPSMSWKGCNNSALGYLQVGWEV